MRVIVGALALVALGSVACGDPDPATTHADVDVPPRVFRHDPAPTNEGEGALVHGIVRYDDKHDCFLLETEGIAYPVVWPAETEGAIDGPGVQLPDGLVVRVGDDITGGGGFHQAGDGYVVGLDIPAECVPSTGEVAVFNVNERVTKP